MKQNKGKHKLVIRHSVAILIGLWIMYVPVKAFYDHFTELAIEHTYTLINPSLFIRYANGLYHLFAILVVFLYCRTVKKEHDKRANQAIMEQQWREDCQEKATRREEANKQEPPKHSYRDLH